MALAAIGKKPPELNRSAVRFARAVGIMVTVLGLGILVGWRLEAPLLNEGVPSSLTITPNSAAGISMSGLGLLALTYRLSRPLARVLGLLLVIGAGTILSHEITGNRTSFDYLLFDLLTDGGSKAASLDISPGAKISFILLGGVLLLTARQALLFKIIVELLLAATLMLSITNLIGHSYEVNQRFNPFPFTQMPIHLGVVQALLVAGFSFACPDRGFSRALLDTSAGGQMIRRLLPGIIIIPILLGWAVHRGLTTGLYGSTVGIAAFAVLTILIMAGFSWLTSIALRNADADRDRALRDFQKQRDSLQTILVSIADAVIVVNPNGRIVFMNPVAESITGRQAKTAVDQFVTDVFPIKEENSGIPIDDPAIRAMTESDSIALYEALLERGDGSSVPIQFSSAPVLNRRGKVEGAVIIFRDISHRRQAEEQMNMLVRELNHRVRNVLMIVHSVVKASAEYTGKKSAGEMVNVLLERLRALGRAHELLLETHWTGADLKRMLQEELEPYQMHDPGKIKLQGKEIFLPPQCTSVVAMSLHELATNAAKYGALSTKKGRLKVSWTLRGSKLTIKWAESNITIPKLREGGFGSSLIEKGIRENLGGETKVEYATNSLTVTLRIPLPSESQGK